MSALAWIVIVAVGLAVLTRNEVLTAIAALLGLALAITVVV